MELKSTIGLNKTIEDIKKGKFFPVYLIYGDENYLIKEAAQKIIEAILPEKDKPSLETFEGGEEDWNKIIQSLNTYPMFGSRRVVEVMDTEIFFSKFIVEELLEESRESFEAGDMEEAVRLYRAVLGYEGFKNITDGRLDELPGFANDPKKTAWLEAMVKDCLDRSLKPIPYEDSSDKLNNAIKKEDKRRGIPANNILILVTDHVDKRKRLYKTINDIGVMIDLSIQKAKRDQGDIEEEEKRTLLQKATELLRRSDKIFAKGAFDTLANKTGYNVGIFLNELGKVILSLKDRKKIEINDIEETVGRTKEDSVFDLQKALGQRDLAKSMFYLNELLGQGEFYLSLLQNIANEIRHLIVAKRLIENELKTKWNSQMDPGNFKQFVYFPILLKMRKEKEKEKEKEKKKKKEKGLGFKKSPYNILNRPWEVIMELLKSSENFTREELYRSMKLLAEIDLKTKRTGVSPIHLLEKALVEICLDKESGKRAASLEL